MHADSTPEFTYQERLARKAERLDSWADSRERKASDALDAAHDATAHIPMGQPILLGHHSQRAHEAALAREDRKRRDAAEHADKAEAFRRRAAGNRKHAERIAQAVELSAEDYRPGDLVRACFTNSGYIRRFEGEVLDRTLNHWKVRATTSPYADRGEEPGRVYKIPCMGRPGFTQNNRIIERVS